MPVETEVEHGDAEGHALDTSDGAPRSAPTPEEQHEAVARWMEAFDVDDDVSDFVHVLIAWSVKAAEASHVEQRLTGYTASVLTTELFEVVEAQLPTIDPSSSALRPVHLPVAKTEEEPRRSDIDVACRHEIHVRGPQLAGKAHTVSSTPRRSKRSTPCGSASGGPTPSTPTRMLFAPASASTSEHPPGVPYSTAPPVVSPRKAVALLKTAVRMAAGRPSAATEEVNTEGSSDNLEHEPDVEPRGAKTPARNPSACSGATSPHAWSIILPRDRLADGSEDDDEVPNDPVLHTTVEVEYVLPTVLPGVGRRASCLSTNLRRTSHSADERRSSRVHFLATDERDAVPIDSIGHVGYEIGARIMSLSAGVRLQSDQGDVLDAGPELPVFPTKMRRSTFVDEAVASAVVDKASPLKPPTPRPWTTSGVGREDASSSSESERSIGVFPLTECSCSTTPAAPKPRMVGSRAPSTQSLSGSVASTVASSTSISVQNLFRKPSKIPRPCTASSQCCSGHNSNCSQPLSKSAPGVERSKNAFTDLAKQRAFQRKPSLATHQTPPKKTQSRRSLLHGASSPLSRRRTTQSLASNNMQSADDEDPLHRATAIL